MKSFIKIVTIILLLTAPAHAQDQKDSMPEEITLDGGNFNADWLRDSFMKSVFTRNVLNESVWGLYFPYYKASSGFFSEKNIEANYPWMLPYIHPQAPLPKLLAINKWAKPVRITFGMPNYLEPLGVYNQGNVVLHGVRRSDVEKFKKSETGVALEKKIVDLSAILTELTNLKVSYVSNDDEDDYSEIRINIIPLSPDAAKEDKFHYKMAGGWPVRYGSWAPRENHFHGSAFVGLDTHFKNGFPFTHDSKRQVDGYILSNSNNELQMSICFIWEGHELSMMKNLISECLLRSMGFLNGVESYHNRYAKPKSYLTYWNDPEKWGKNGVTRPPVPEGDISEFDQYMIKTLYNTALKPGMDYVEAQKILLGVQ